MRKILILISLTLFYFSNALAVTLYDALNQTYQNNIQLNAERENIKASEEDINISKADYKDKKEYWDYQIIVNFKKKITQPTKTKNQWQ